MHSLTPDIFLSTPPVQALTLPEFSRQGISVSVLRCDLLHPEVSGNKWYKLKYNLKAARQARKHTLLSFGGAWSNHIHALAAAGRLFGFQTLGIIRGELSLPLSPCLQDARRNGMQLHGISRTLYRQKNSEEFRQQLRAQFGDFFLIPEGGANLAGIKGCADILDGVEQDQFDLICLACGTGTTLTGLLTTSRLPLLGFQVLKGVGYLRGEVEEQVLRHGLRPTAPWCINEDFHYGGYARTTPELLNFTTSFSERTGVPLEPVYSGKMLLGLTQLILKGTFSPGSRLLVIHGGGLQGKRGFLRSQ